MTRKKFAHEGTSQENAVPGTHADASAKAAQLMRAVIQTCEEMFPGLHIAVMMIEPESERTNYASNCHRGDAIALMRAIADRLEEEARTQ